MIKTTTMLILGIIFGAVLPLSSYGQVSRESTVSEKANSDYKIKAKDWLDIRTSATCEFTTKFEVNESGMLMFPLIGEVKAQDLTVNELELEITSRLKKYLKSPRVVIKIIKKEN